MEGFEALMTRIFVNGLNVCSLKCVPTAERDYLNNFEKNCVGKCMDKHVEIYMQAHQKLVEALQVNEPDKDF